MLKLKTDVKFDECKCNLLFEDVTGFSQDHGLDGGFIPEGVNNPSNRDFKLSNGVFFHLIHQLDVNDKSSDIDIGDEVVLLTPEVVSPIYKDNIVKESIKIPDGKIFLKRYFIMTKDYFDGLPSNWFDPELPIVYFDDARDRIHYQSKEITVDLNCSEMLLTYLDPTVQGIAMDTFDLFSICSIEACYRAMVEDKLDLLLGFSPRDNKYKGKCRSGNCLEDQDNNDLELLKAAIASLKYLLQCELFDDALRLLGLIGNCGGICNKYNTGRQNGCGC